jgi:glucan phosphoethanolaminetransferase (alkaline phosphatase superfamily)
MKIRRFTIFKKTLIKTMEKQSFKNHIRYYTPHHFIYYPIIMALLACSVYFILTTENKLIWTFITAIFVVLFCLALMLRQHYALTLQNRIVRLELRYRYFAQTWKRFEDIENQLNDDQLFALRFAADEELKGLIDRTLLENLSGTEIKKAIINWNGDYDRV